MNKRIIIATVLLAAGLQTAWAQGVKVWQNGKAVYYELGSVDSIAFDESCVINGHEWVDLGLPSGTLWATCNVDANAPEEYGDYFAWGETQMKEEYIWESYLYGGDVITKYYSDDGLTELLPEDDAATVNWDGLWQLPSKEQLEELFSNEYSTIESVAQKGVNGFLITSKSNGKSLFLPTAGEYWKMGYSAQNDGWYWSRSLCQSYNEAWSVRFFTSNDAYGIQSISRYLGLSARPVRKQ